MFYLQKMVHKQCYSQQLRHPEHWVGLAFWNIRCKGVGSEGLVDEEHEFSIDEVFNFHILAYLHIYIYLTFTNRQVCGREKRSALRIMTLLCLKAPSKDNIINVHM